MEKVKKKDFFAKQTTYFENMLQNKTDQFKRKLTADFFVVAKINKKTDVKQTWPIQNQQPCTDLMLKGVQRSYIYQEKSYPGENASWNYRERLHGSIIFF